MYCNIFDTHSHYDSKEFDADRGELLTRLPRAGVKAVMCAAADLKSAELGAQYAKQHEYMYCSAGVHPHDAKDAPADLKDRISELAGYEKCRAVGEIGLDYHYDFSPRDVQKSVFTSQLEIAKDLNLPVIIHDREAHGDMLEILKKYRPKGIIHCYSGSPEMAEELLKLGFYIGFTGVLTFKNAKKAVESVRIIPENRLLIETDCPYMAPVPYRGKRSDSSMLTEVARVMAEIKGIDTQKMLDITCQNGFEVYGIS